MPFSEALSLGSESSLALDFHYFFFLVKGDLSSPCRAESSRLFLTQSSQKWKHTLLEIIVLSHLQLLTCHRAKQKVVPGPHVIPAIAAGTRSTFIVFSSFAKMELPLG